MSKAWGVGAWALEAEKEEAEERERAKAEEAAKSQSFPSLKEAVATKPKKKKPVTIPLPQFAADAYIGGGRHDSLFQSKGLNPDELLRLPTGPRERAPDEVGYGRLGGGFRSYGGGDGQRGGFGGRRSDDGDGSWGGGRKTYGGGFDEEPRRARVSDLDQPSRADEVDNWAASKKPLAHSSVDSGRQDRYSLLSGSSSRADEVDNWSLGKKPALPISRKQSYGSGFRDSPASSSDSDQWRRGGVGLLPHNGERPRLILDPPKGGGDVGGAASEPARTRPSPFGAARPREEVLAEKGLDWRKVDTEIAIKKTSRPNSSHSTRSYSAQSGMPESSGSAPEGPVKSQRPKVNPFGDAKPREVVLQAQGKDWRKIDLELEHRGIDRPETNEEKVLKEEIDHLKKTLTEITEENLKRESSTEEATTLFEQISQKERELEQLIAQLDDKVRFGQRANASIDIMRPSSGAGRTGMSLDSRPHSRSGVSEDARNMEFMERPWSRGGRGDAWAKPMDDRRGRPEGTERGYLGNRHIDRSMSRERW